MFAIQVNDQIRLELLQPWHSAPLFAVVEKHRAYLSEFLPWPPANTELSHTQAFIASQLSSFGAGKVVPCVIYYQEEVVGLVDLQGISQANKTAEIGYWLAQSHMGKGIVSQSVLTLLELGFTRLQLNRIAIRAAVGNAPSNAVALRVGMRLEGCLRQVVTGNHGDHNVYSLLRDEWLASREP